MPVQGQKVPSVKPPLTSGTKLAFKLGAAKKIPVIALLSRIWPSLNVGVFIDVPMTGTPQMRVLMGRYGVYAVEKAAQKLYRSADFGVFNPKEGKDGIDSIEAKHNIASDGAPTNLRIQLTVKPHKLGTVLASFLSRLQFEPPSSDLSSSLLCGFPKDIAVLHGVAQHFYDELNNRATIAIIGGKKASIKGSIAEKFEKKFEKAYKKPNLGKTSQANQVELMPYSFSAKLRSINTFASVIVAHALSHYGTVCDAGNAIELTTDPDYVYYAHKMSANILSSINRASLMLSWYQKESIKDEVNGKSIGTIFAIAAIAVGLRITTAIELLPISTLNIPAVAKDVASAGMALKELKIAKPAKTPSGGSSDDRAEVKKPSSTMKKKNATDDSELPEDENWPPEDEEVPQDQA